MSLTVAGRDATTEDLEAAAALSSLDDELNGLAPEDLGETGESEDLAVEPADALDLFEDVQPVRMKDASSRQILEQIRTFFQSEGIAKQNVAARTNGANWVLDYLNDFPGDDWEAKWEASPLHNLTTLSEWVSLIAPDAAETQRRHLSSGITALFAFDVLRPVPLMVMEMNGAKFWDLIPRVRQDPHAHAFAAFPGGTPQNRAHANGVLGRLLLLTGKPIAALTNADLLAIRTLRRRLHPQVHGIEHLWSALASLDGGKVTGSFREAVRQGPKSVAELVDLYPIQSQRLRDFFIAYLTRHESGVDYGSLRGLAYNLVNVFWCGVEAIEPGVDSLNLSPETAEAWRKEAKLKRVGNEIVERRTWPQTFFSVRAMYFDVQQWAHDEPETWAAWACRSPVSDEHLRGVRKIDKRRTSRMHQRTRERAPVAARLADAAEDTLTEIQELVAAAQAVQRNEGFTVQGQRYRRDDDGSEGRHLVVRQLTGSPPIPWSEVRQDRRARSPERANRRDLTVEEEYAFWAFCVIETLRHTGVRIEEMLELTQMDLVDYQHSSGTAILLRVNPSKMDQERILVVPPELAAVFAQMMRRIRAASGTSEQALPNVVAYDAIERKSLPPMPMLFQVTAGRGLKGTTKAMSRSLVRTLIRATCMRVGITGPDGEVLHFTPHDFRRIFATDSLSSGMPPHIIAKLLGHESLATTQQYMAIYPQDVIDAHRSFIAARRALPERREDYRTVTDQEWQEFSEHFGKRKIAIGDCMRAYGTNCSHEYACEQCSLARPDEGARPRLTSIVSSLEEQMVEATHRGWQGEIERLTHIRQAVLEKIEDLDRSARRTQVVSLPMPALRPAGVS